MDWLSKTIYGKPSQKRRRLLEENNGNHFFYGTGPDDSLNSSLSDDDDTFKNSPTESSFSSKANSSAENIAILTINKTGWRNTEYVPPFYFEENDFARVPYSYNQDPQIIRLYSDQGGPRAQIGKYENVLMSEMEGCYIDQNLSSKNVLLIIENINEDSFRYYEEGLTRLLASFRDKQKNILRCVLWMECYYHAPLFSTILSTYCCNLLELNIGARRRPELPLRHPPYDFNEESLRVLSLLETWLLASENTIKCLRLYTFLQLDKTITSLINLCLKLEHLTLSKIIEVDTCCEFPNIKTFELDKQRLAYTDNDLSLMKRTPGMFPAVRKIRITGNNFSPLIETLIIRLGCVSRSFEVSYDEIDLADAEKIIHKKSSLTTHKKYHSRHSPNRIKALRFKNNTYHSNILLLNGTCVYPAPT